MAGEDGGVTTLGIVGCFRIRLFPPTHEIEVGWCGRVFGEFVEHEDDPCQAEAGNGCKDVGVGKVIGSCAGILRCVVRLGLGRTVYPEQ